MYPFITILGKDISTYSIMAIAGLLIAGYYFTKRIKNENLDDNDAILFLLSVSVGILVGGNTLFAITNIDKFYLLLQTNNTKEFFSVLLSFFSGSVFYGGLIGACISGMIFIKIKKLPFNIYADNCALCAPLFHAIARIGCFLGGCCYGIESCFGFRAIGNSLTDIGEIRRFPVQLLEALLNLLIFVVIYFLIKHKKLNGLLFYLYVAMYALSRFFIEFLRGDEIRGFIFGLSTSQFISIILETSVIAFFIYKWRSKRIRKATL